MCSEPARSSCIELMNPRSTPGTSRAYSARSRFIASTYIRSSIEALPTRNWVSTPMMTATLRIATA